MTKKILFPTDFSNNPWSAMHYVTKLFEKQICDFYIMNAYSKERYGLESISLLDPDEAFDQESKAGSEKALNKIMTSLVSGNHNSLHRFHIAPRSETFLNAVKNSIEEFNIDIVVIATQGQEHGHKGKYGKNTIAVIETVRECPVLVIPETVHLNRPREIVLATDFNTTIKTNDIHFLLEIANICKANIQVLSLVDNASMSPKQRSNKIGLRNCLNEVEHSFNVLHNVSMQTALSYFVQIRNSNMICFVDRQPSFLKRLGIGKPNLKKLGYHEKIPILALRD